MAYFRYKLDSVIVVDPIGWDNFTAGFSRILDTRSVSILKPEGELTFIEDGFDAIETEYNTNGICGQLALNVEYREDPSQAWTSIFTGIIWVSDCEFNLEEKFVEVAIIRDDSYMSRLNANRDVKAQIDVGRSKNDETITAVSSVNIDFYNPALGLASYTYTNRPCWQVYDILEFLVKFCSDGDLAFDSVYFGAGGAGEHIFIITGEGLRTGNSDPPTLSWAQVLKELYVKFNVVPIVDETVSPAKIWVEPASDTFEETVSTNIQGTDIRGLKRRALPFSASASPYSGDKPLSNFSSIKLGNSKSLATGSYPDIEFKGWKEEEYFVLGDCGFAETFDLTGSWIADSNIIEDVLVTPSSSYDSDIFIVETQYPGTAKALKYDIVSPGAGPYTYNDDLTNENISARFLGAVPNSIAKYLGDGNDGFQAEKTGTTSDAVGFINLNPVDFNDDATPPNNDPNGNYDAAVNYRYTAPANGYYQYQVELTFQNVVTVPLESEWFDCLVTLRRYNAGGTLLESRTQTIRVTADTTLTYNLAGFYLVSTDYVDVKLDCSPDLTGPGIISYDLTGGFFLSTVVTTGGGVYQTYDPGAFRGSFHLFEVPMSFTDFINMTQYPTRLDAVFVNRGGFPNDITGWIVKADYVMEKGLAVIELISTDNTN